MKVAEHLTHYGRAGMTEIQLLELIGIPQEAARELLAYCDNQLSILSKMTQQEITATKGITAIKAAAIVAAFEIGRRRQTETAHIRPMITSSLDMYDILNPLMRDETQEVFYIVLLDRRNKVIRTEKIHIGGMSAMVVDPKVIFQKALQYKACAFVMSHNHPLGAPSPSIEDIRLTERIKAAGSFIDIKLLDHIVIGEGCYYSFADEGKI